MYATPCVELERKKMAHIHPHHSLKASPEVLTVWKKALFFSGTGFLIYNSFGNLLFRVENWAPNVTTQLILTDATGNPVLFLRRKVVSLHQRWEGLMYNEGDRPSGRRVFSIKSSSILSATTSIDVIVDSSNLTKECVNNHAHYHIEGSFRDRACSIYTTSHILVAQVKRKHESGRMAVDKGVFSLVVYPGFDQAMVTSWIVILDRMNQEYVSNILLSALYSTFRSYRFIHRPRMCREDKHSNKD